MSTTTDVGRSRRPLRAVLKRFVLQVHLTLGILFCLLFVMWCVSGVVLMYAGYPTLSIPDRLAHFSPLDCRTCHIGPADLARAIPAAAASPVLRLGMRSATPVWRFLDADYHWAAADASTGKLLGAVTVAEASAIAMRWRARASTRAQDGVQALFTTLVTEPDQWTLTGSVSAELPLMQFDLTDGAGTRVYIAPRSGEVLAASTRRDRALAWIGAIPHWIFPVMLRRNDVWWTRLVLTISALGTLMSLAGLTIGVWQWRGRRSRSGARRSPSPYRSFMLRWHHLFGLTFGLVVTTWVFSGLLSLNPGGWSPGIGATRAQRTALQGGTRELARFLVAPDSIWRIMQRSGRAPRELLVSQVAGRPLWTAYDADGSTRLLYGDVYGNAAESPLEMLPASSLLSLAASLVKNATITDTSTLTRYDSYYHDPTGHLSLPVIRVRYDDPASTWLYLDPRLGTITQRMQRRSRLERWLYLGLHDFDFAWLTSRRPLWDMVVITLSIGALLCALSGTVIGMRWLAAQFRGARPDR